MGQFQDYDRTEMGIDVFRKESVPVEGMKKREERALKR